MGKKRNETAAAELRAAEEKSVLDVAAVGEVCFKDTLINCTHVDCDPWRGPTECVQVLGGWSKHCLCPSKLCAKDGYCVHITKSQPMMQLQLQSKEEHVLCFASAFAAFILATFVASWSARRRPWR